MASDLVPFGKYKGQPVEVLAEDHDYCDWLMAQSWFRDRYQGIYTLIVNNFQEASETPEHNALQVLFLDDDFCARVIRVAYPLEVEGTYCYVCERLKDIKTPKPPALEVWFEIGGADVLIDIVWWYKKDSKMIAYTNDDHDNHARFIVEIKPAVGDDYPAVIRQMRAIRLKVLKILFVGVYRGVGATEEQFIETMKRSGIRVVFIRDVQ